MRVVQRQKGFVLRKSYGRAPVTQLALQCVLRHSPWATGWKDYAFRATDHPKGFIEELRRTKGANVSDPFGSVTFVEGNGWVAYAVNGYCHFGPQKFVRLYTSEDARLEEMPKPIREVFQLSKASQL